LVPRSGGLLGRDAEIVGVAEALEVSRLVTLTGAPGIGKTRLALAVAEGRRYRSALVEVAAVADPALVPSALASALSVREVPGQGLMETVVATLRGRSLLLVLDNCEHLLGACAATVDELLVGCPQVRVLATSREPLGLEGERVCLVPPLPVPEQGADTDAEKLMGYPSVALFVQRAGEVNPGFALHSFVAAAVAEICRRLDGIPLAIELAAARVEMFTPIEIARRLADRFRPLSDRGPSPIRRHRTLELALDWSHELLSAPERALLRRLSVFAGRFELDAAAATCVDEQVDPPGVSELLTRLASKSLLVADAGGDGTVGYRLLETIRAYAGEKLEWADEVAELRTAHARFYLMLAERAEPELAGPLQADWFERLEAERANVRAAVDWWMSCGRTDCALRLSGALVLFWRARCHFTEGRDLLRAVLLGADGQAPALRARVLWGVGFLTHMAGDPKGAIPLLEQSLTSFREQDDGQGCARALLVLGNAQLHWDDPVVPALLEESASLARRAGDSWCLALALGVAGFERDLHHEGPRARELFEESIAVARDAGDLQSMSFGLIGLGSLAVAQGDYREAESLLPEAVQVAGELGAEYDKAIALHCLGAVAFGRGEYGRAGELLDEALALLAEVGHVAHRIESMELLARVTDAQGDRHQARRVLQEVAAAAPGAETQALGELAMDEGDRDEGRRLFELAGQAARGRQDVRRTAQALHWLGRLARAEGDPDRASSLHEEALQLWHQVGDLRMIAGSLEAIAGLAAEAGRSRHAARLFGAAMALRDRRGYARDPLESRGYNADVAIVRESLPAGELASALAHGEALSLEAAEAEASAELRRTRHANGRRSLTKRERQVAQLVAEGLTNPEIAERLVITHHTVDTHVEHIFSKLGVTRRWELAHDSRFTNAEPSWAHPPAAINLDLYRTANTEDQAPGG
jgi:predicted ATPase/DNA-binding CsgD family transcriptional regulator